MKNLIFFPHNINLNSIIKQKNKINESKNRMLISPIPSHSSKKKFKKSTNVIRQQSNSNKFFYDIPLYKTSMNNSSVSKEKNNTSENCNELLKQNDFSSHKKKIQIIKIEIDMTNKMIKDNNKNLELLKDDLKDLNKEKKNQQKIFENNLSKKETLEDICNTIINNIKNSNLTNSINDDYYIEITLEDIKNNNKNLYINKVFEAFNFINNYNNTKYLNYIRMIIEEAYSDFYSYLNNNKVYDINNIINNFFIGISSKFSSQINCRTSKKAVDLLLKFILKINVITEIIHGVIHFLEHEYKDRKNEIKEKLAEIEKKLESLQHQKDE